MKATTSLPPSSTIVSPPDVSSFQLVKERQAFEGDRYGAGSAVSSAALAVVTPTKKALKTPPKLFPRPYRAHVEAAARPSLPLGLSEGTSFLSFHLSYHPLPFSFFRKRAAWSRSRRSLHPGNSRRRNRHASLFLLPSWSLPHRPRQGMGKNGEDCGSQGGRRERFRGGESIRKDPAIDEAEDPGSRDGPPTGRATELRPSPLRNSGL
jgi:hypothetical protein